MAAAAIPLVALQAVSILDARRQAERRAATVLREQVHDVAEHMRNHLLTAEHLLSFLATRRVEADHQIEEVGKRLRSMMSWIKPPRM